MCAATRGLCGARPFPLLINTDQKQLWEEVMAGAWKWELKQRPWRISWCLLPCFLVRSACFNITKDHPCPGVLLPTEQTEGGKRHLQWGSLF